MHKHPSFQTIIDPLKVIESDFVWIVEYHTFLDTSDRSKSQLNKDHYIPMCDGKTSVSDCFSMAMPPFLHSNEVWVPSFHVVSWFSIFWKPMFIFPFNWRMLKSQKLIMFWVVPHLKVGYVMWHIRLCLVSCKVQRCKYNKFGQLARRTLRPHSFFLWTIPSGEHTKSYWKWPLK